ncbi:tetrahydroberberine oxidase-like [Salvia miltiorrhiza]|uniref:tetrahydroberberine oxidase-like n=1 Tax=Salvia miltiorrhiza TaxID=226208 RepID=UPI0025AC8E33|nr:tetrahydroberberine oxidase-like [Salvia miltiorrhiza]
MDETSFHNQIIMKAPSILSLTFILLAIISCSRASSCADDFLQCLRKEFHNYSSISNNIYTPINSSYSSILQLTIQNPRFASDPTPSPLIIITPQHESQIPPLIHCAKESGLQIRTRSGGHDFEGLSYLSQVPFVIIDLIKFNEIKVDVEHKTAWVGVGATIGSLYYAIAERSPILGFPAGICPTVGLGGYFSGGGYGTMMRKYGLAADNVIDARIIDVNGRLLGRESMGEDLFWAIRGGGGASFGVIVAWKVQLVDVPKRVTVFRVSRTLEQNATQIIHRWQYIAPKLNKDLFIAILLTRTNTTRSSNNMTINASFFSLFLGGVDRLLPLMQESFPELGLVRQDCAEVSWIQAMVFIAGFPVDFPPQVLLNRTDPSTRRPFKGKSNYVQQPIPEYGLEGFWRHFFEEEAESALIAMTPYGGRMAEISESAIPFPHRAANLYKLLHVVFWGEDENQDPDKYIKWSRRVDTYLTPYVSSNPREAYVNYRDLDLGVNNVHGDTTYKQASIWGRRYFKNNFRRLVRIKSVVDPKNFFNNEQSIPPLH